MICLDKYFEAIISLNKNINGFIWITIGIPLLLFAGVLITCALKGFQITHFRHIFKNTIGKLFSKKKSMYTVDNSSISQFQALCTTLAATIGVGNITGVSSAILTGGPGAVLWMWVAAFLGMITTYAENVLGIYFRTKNSSSEWSGGAMFYLHNGVGKIKGFKKFGKILAILFSLFTVLSSFGIGNMSQINTITNNITTAFEIDKLTNTIISIGTYNLDLYTAITGLLLMIVIGIIISGGLKKIVTVTEKIVPFMVILFTLGSIIVIIINYKNIFKAFALIFTCAFNEKSIFGGVTGISIKFVIEQGFKRGMFTNEAGMGSSVMINSNSNVIEPARQGMWGIIEVFIDTIIMCTLTALVVLTSGVINLENGTAVTNNPAILVAKAFNTAFDFNIGFGEIFIAISTLLFAFSTVLGWSHYGSKAIEYLTDNNKKFIDIYKSVFIIAIFIGAVSDNTIIWDISDTFNGLMMIPNLIGVLILLPLVIRITNNYTDRHIKKINNITPLLSYDTDIQNEQHAKLEIDGD